MGKEKETGKGKKGDGEGEEGRLGKWKKEKGEREERLWVQMEDGKMGKGHESQPDGSGRLCMSYSMLC